MYKLFISLTISVIVIVISLLSSDSEPIKFSNHVNIDEHNIRLLQDIMSLTTRSPKPDSEQITNRCFSNHINIEKYNIQLFPDIMTATKKPKLGKTVFFHETSCSKGFATLNAR